MGIGVHFQYATFKLQKKNRYDLKKKKSYFGQVHPMWGELDRI